MTRKERLEVLLQEKKHLKSYLHSAKKKLEAQHIQIDIQRQRALEGKVNTLAFEQKQLVFFESEIVKLKKRQTEVKYGIRKLKEEAHINISKTNEKEKPEQLSVRQIALFYVYQGLIITRKNGDDIAKKYDHTSGEYIFQKFTYYSKRKNRIEIPETERKIKSKIQLFESVAELLPNDRRESILDEINVLKSALI